MITKAISLDAISAGKSYIKDCNIIFTESGEQTISIALKYTDTNGEEILEKLGSYTVSVDVASSNSALTNNTNDSLVLLGRIIAFIALIGVVITVFMYFKKK